MVLLALLLLLFLFSFLLLKPNSDQIITLLKKFPYFPFAYS